MLMHFRIFLQELLCKSIETLYMLQIYYYYYYCLPLAPWVTFFFIHEVLK